MNARRWLAWENSQGIVISLISVFAFFSIWEVAGSTCIFWDLTGRDCNISPLFISAPSKIGLAAIRLFCVPPENLRDAISNVCPAGIKPDLNSNIWHDLYVSGQEFFIGFAIAIALGIPFGLLLGWYRTFSQVFEPFVAALNATPRVALTPLLILWLGLGIWSKVALVFMGGIFPIILNTQSGVRALDETFLRAARSFGANDRQIFRTIALPGSVPFILAGIRVGLGRALVGIVVGELIGATAGVGHMMHFASQMFQIDRMFVGLFLITGFGVLITYIVNRLERRFEAWRPQRA